MKPSDHPDHEAARLTEIRALDLAVLRPKIERLSRLARSIADVPYAYISVAEGDRVWQSSFEGQPEGLIPRETSMAAFAIAAGRPIYTPDARIVAPNHPWVTGAPHVRFFCGAPIRIAGNLIIGAFCVASPVPRDEVDPAVVGLVEDIASLLGDEIERLRAERHLAEAESEAEAAHKLLKSFVQGAPVALAMTDRDLRFVEVSPRWRLEYGVQGRVIGRGVRDLFPEAFVHWGPSFQQALAGETIVAERGLVHLPDGSTRWVRGEMSPWRDSKGEIGGVVVMTNDISDTIASLERAERSEQRLRLAVEIADLMVYEADYRTGEVRVEGAEDTFLERPLTFKELSRDPWIAIHPEDRPAAIELWEQRVRDGTPFRTEYRINRSDGKEIWAYGAANLVLDADGQPERLVGILKNITVRKQAEVAVAAARDAAEAANRAKSEFLANMSHEIRTPLNGVMGIAAALARSDLTPQQHEMVGLIESSAATLEAIVSDVLDVSRIESGHLELRPERFDLELCLRPAAALFETAACEKGLSFDVKIAEDALGAYEGDPVRIRQIVGNLLSNAIKFTETRGVRLSVDSPRKGVVEIAVSDTGIGFDEAMKERLFERFEQADGSITRKFGGSGLGLAISRSLATAMGGQLEATSEVGRGSRFVLILPLQPCDEADEPAPVAETLALEHTPRVLLAEDHPINQRVIELILGTAGVDLVCVQNGREAVEAAGHEAFDLILMDMQMPEMDGLTAIRAIRASERAKRRPRTPIWGLSANALPEHIAASMAAGADGHLTKPVSAPALFQVLSQACAGGPPTQALSA